MVPSFLLAGCDSQLGECTACYRAVHLKTGKMANSMFCVFDHDEKKKKKERLEFLPEPSDFVTWESH